MPSFAVHRCQRQKVRSLCDGSAETVTAVPTTGEALPPAKLAVVAALLDTTGRGMERDGVPARGARDTGVQVLAASVLEGT